MIVKFFDKSQPDIFVDEARGQRLKAALTSDIKWLEIDDCMYATSSIASIAPGEQQSIDTVKRIGGVADNTGGIHSGSPLDITEEERLHKLEMVRKLREDFKRKRGMK